MLTTKRSEAQRTLEHVIRGLLSSPDVQVTYAPKGTPLEEEQTTPVWVLPLEFIDNQARGFFRLDESLADASIGFAHTRGFGTRVYYHLDPDGTLTRIDRNEETVYLSLALTNCYVDVNRSEREVLPTERRFGPGNCYRVLGIEGIVDGSPQVYPLALAIDTEEGLALYGVYLRSRDEVRMYRLADPPRREVRELLGRARLGDEEDRSEREEDERESAASDQGTTIVRAPSVSPARRSRRSRINWEDPRTVVRYLDEYVIGQERAKKAVAVAISNYMIRARDNDEEIDIDHLLLIGPSGVGKTYMLELLAEIAGFPFIETKVTGKSTTGYKGENLSRIFERLRAKTKVLAPYAFVVLDEIDKLAKDGNSFGRELQDEIIGWIGGTTVACTEYAKLGTTSEQNSLDTRNILFIGAGAFQGAGNGTRLTDIIEKRQGEGRGRIGFGREQGPARKSRLYDIKPEDIITYGLKPELVGRLHYIGVLDALSTADKGRILTEARRSPLHSYQRLMERRGYRLEIGDGLPEYIAERCPAETGARALRAVCAELFREILFDPGRYATADKTISVTPQRAREVMALYGEQS